MSDLLSLPPNKYDIATYLETTAKFVAHGLITDDTCTYIVGDITDGLIAQVRDELDEEKSVHEESSADLKTVAQELIADLQAKGNVVTISTYEIRPAPVEESDSSPSPLYGDPTHGSSID